MALTQKKTSKETSVKSFVTTKGNDVDTFCDSDDQGLGRRFLDRLNQHKDKINQVEAGTGATETCASVRSRSIKVAMEMEIRGIIENDIILICSRSHADQTIAVLATLILGAIVAPLDPDCPIADFKNFVLSLKPRMVFCDLRVSGQLEHIIKSSSEIPSCPLVVFGDRTDRLAFEKFLLQEPPPDFKAVAIKDPRRKVAFVIPSQGTSGPPKLVCISHHAVRLQITTYSQKLFEGTEKILSFFPLSWITQTIVVCSTFEWPIIRVLPNAFSERPACRLIHDLAIDSAVLGTEYAMRIARHVSLQDFDLSCLKRIFVGGDLTTAGDMVHLRAAFRDVNILQCYGLTEMTCLVSGFTCDDYQAALEKPGSIGRPMAGLKYKIVDCDTRETLGPDWWGELLLSAPTLMLGYYKDVNATNAVMEKGYYKTGDVAQYDNDGYLYIQGRASDHILQNGRRFFPNDLEQMLMTHPHVHEAVVIGNDKELVACVVKQPSSSITPESLTEFMAERIDEERLPTRIKLMDSFPRTTAGKLKRNLLRQSVLNITIEHSKSIVSFEEKG